MLARCAASLCAIFEALARAGEAAPRAARFYYLCVACAVEEKAEAKARQKERVAAILAGTDAAGAGAGVEEALNCWEEEAYEAETLQTLETQAGRHAAHLQVSSSCRRYPTLLERQLSTAGS